MISDAPFYSFKSFFSKTFWATYFKMNSTCSKSKPRYIGTSAVPNQTTWTFHSDNQWGDHILSLSLCKIHRGGWLVADTDLTSWLGMESQAWAVSLLLAPTLTEHLLCKLMGWGAERQLGKSEGCKTRRHHCCRGQRKGQPRAKSP